MNFPYFGSRQDIVRLCRPFVAATILNTIQSQNHSNKIVKIARLDNDDNT